MPLSSSQVQSLRKRGLDVQKKLSEGGQGEVFRAIKLDSKEAVALKAVPKSRIRSDSDVFAIKQEVKILRELDHSHIVGFIDAFTDPEGAYIALEFLGGLDLYEVMKKGTRFTEKQALLIIRQVIDALAYLHERGISHCDIKLENVVFAESDSLDIIKVIDFGIAHVRKRGHDDKPGISMLGASKEYLSPELALSHHNIIPEPVDIWCTGILLYVLIARRFPFNTSGLEKAERAKKVLECNLEFPEQQFGNISAATKSIIAEMLKRDAEDRPTAVEILFRVDANLIKLSSSENQMLGSARLLPHLSSSFVQPRDASSPSNAFTRKLLSRFDSMKDLSVAVEPSSGDNLKKISSNGSSGDGRSSGANRDSRSALVSASGSSTTNPPLRTSMILARPGFFKLEEERKMISPRTSRVNLRAEIVEASRGSNSGSQGSQGVRREFGRKASDDIPPSSANSTVTSAKKTSSSRWLKKLFDRKQKTTTESRNLASPPSSVIQSHARSNSNPRLNGSASKDRPPVS
uniref:Protein kinase domain-containing protein n=1 Tax=Timspurckia oligopyrenoides TaxID=708627 RepID=A0A7S1ER63_9RHOD|mmetsp:Transcript_2038/g.3601  ORF Transcript_2038/g.3601 Transcript_2038/m.3601 type:complete len:519 (+) Transcript_2038:117-1673(+)|eukprot:CAMPEP_0182445970 /NCGR_PEP_ID=MMETSP1172-20130603/3900_1 /TAXON_ID=708627 /ORGANISM="Timspurckia oligopyrenoides, Strain CCMP3278" /LENGTH=518 /DNA_ID=CAMNT_0024641819 /DNA_START=113 /DNA_END=1669 /DNA_ORIENTATION=-